MEKQPQQMTHSFQLMDAEIKQFNDCFDLSGMRSKSEFIRFCLFSAMRDLYAKGGK